MDSSSEEKGAAMAVPPLKPSEKFHLFVSYSSMDATWTHELIGRLETDHPGLRVCLHERDFTPGRNILENMAECIHQSQKVLLVLSQDFVQSRWCLLEADLSLFGYCLERKPVIPVLLRPCQVPLHLSHLTYLEAVDSRFYSKVVQLLCTPSHCMARSLPGPRPVPSFYSGKTLLTLNCVNRDSLPSWKVGTFSTLSVPDPLKEVLPDPEVYKHAVGILNGVQSPRSCLRYLCCRVVLSIVLILIFVASIFFLVVFGLKNITTGVRFLLITATMFFCLLPLVLAVNSLCWFRRFSRRKMREVALRVGGANLLLAPHSVLMACETLNQLSFVFVQLEECRGTFRQAPEGEALFREALLRFSCAYAGCLVPTRAAWCRRTSPAARTPRPPGATWSPACVSASMSLCSWREANPRGSGRALCGHAAPLAGTVDVAAVRPAWCAASHLRLAGSEGRSDCCHPARPAVLLGPDRLGRGTLVKLPERRPGKKCVRLGPAGVPRTGHPPRRQSPARSGCPVSVQGPEQNAAPPGTAPCSGARRWEQVNP